MKLENAILAPASYWCRNASVCRKRFATETELSQHLQVEIFTSDELKSFAISSILGETASSLSISFSCVRCHAYTHWRQPDCEVDFRNGCKLQLALTPEIPHEGLSICVAEFISKRMIFNICGCCKRDQYNVLDYSKKFGGNGLFE